MGGGVCQVYLESTQVCPTLVLGSGLGLLTSMCTSSFINSTENSQLYYNTIQKHLASVVCMHVMKGGFMKSNTCFVLIGSEPTGGHTY